ncbi:MAG: hypothetical protein NWR72_17430 [Bacteroidia bacterium]|nr:hypothetical protein [Bacteroidia bacterium]
MSSELFERKLRERFAQAEIQPPAELWDRIEAGIAPDSGKKRRLIWLWWPLTALLLVSSGLAWVFYPANTAGLAQGPQNQTGVAAAPDMIADKDSCLLSLEESSMGIGHAKNDHVISETEVKHATFSSAEINSTRSSRSTQSSIHIPQSEREPLLTVSSPPQNQEAEIPPHENVAIDQAYMPSAKLQPFWKNFSTKADLEESLASIHLNKVKRHGKWSLDLLARSQYATGFQPSFALSNLSNADYAGYANRSDFSTVGSSQVAAVAFPRWHQTLGLEVGHSIASRWRMSLGLEGKIGWGGMATLGSFAGGLSPINSPQDGAIVVEANSITFDEPMAFQHVTLSAPLRMSYLIQAGRGTLENSAGISLNRSWTRIDTLNPVEALAFLVDERPQTGTLQMQPTPVLETVLWHSDLRLRSRYLFPSRSTQQVFIGLECQTQVSAAFRGEAGVRQRPFSVGIEAGIRFH